MNQERSCIRIYVDGAARGNPGPAGAGVVIMDDNGIVIDEGSCYLGERTNNQAEYAALIVGLSKARSINPESVTIFSDSQLLVKQMRGEFRVKNEKLRPLFEEAVSILDSLSKVEFVHIPRNENKRADKLANAGIDSNAQVISTRGRGDRPWRQCPGEESPGSAGQDAG